MHESFLELLYEFCVNTKEDPELLEYAEEMCDEHPDTKATAITELRQMIFDRQECYPYKTDDEYLLRFLRARRFVVRLAHKLLVRYCNFREENSFLYKRDLWRLAKVGDILSSTLRDHPDTGKIIIFRINMWDPKTIHPDELCAAVTAMMEIGIRQPIIQVFGGILIVDLEGITLKHVTSFTPTTAHRIVCILGLALPTRVRSCHVINYSSLVNPFLYVLKKFIPQIYWNRIHLHGNDLQSLHRHIDPVHLPPKYGGTVPVVSFETWLKKMKIYKDEKFDKDLRDLGFEVK